MLDLELVKIVIYILIGLISISSAVYVFFTSTSKANSETLALHEARISAIETEIKHLPDKDDVTDLKIEITRLAGTVGRLDEATKGISRVVTRIDSYMMRNPDQ